MLEADEVVEPLPMGDPDQEVLNYPIYCISPYFYLDKIRTYDLHSKEAVEKMLYST